MEKGLLGQESIIQRANEQAGTHDMPEADDLMHAMIDSAPFGVHIWDNTFNIIDCNKAAVFLLKLSDKKELIDDFDSFSPEFQPDGTISRVAVVEAVQKAFEDGFFRCEWNHCAADGELIPSEVTLVRVSNKGEKYVTAYMRDMREQKEWENDLVRANERNELQLAKMNLMVKATKIGLWDMIVVPDDPTNKNNYIRWSDEFRKILGFTDESDFPNLVRSLQEHMHPDDVKRIAAAMTDHLMDKSGETPYDIEYRIKKKNGEYAFVHATGETIRDSEGNPLQVAGAIMDITETKNLITAAENQRIAAEEASKAKSAFLSTMSHEIRTPMNAILGIAEIELHNETLDADTRDALEKIYTSGDLLLSIINDILDLSKIEAGKLDLLVDKYELASLISDTAQLNSMRIGSKRLEFELYVDETMPSHMMGDVLRVKQVLNNLLSNAFKYTELGFVKLTVSAEDGENENSVCLVFTVSDTGQGMTDEQLGTLFDEYSRFNHETNRATEGTGLGMSITKNLVHMMDGTIHVESSHGKGSVFTVRLPQGRCGKTTIGKETAENLQEFRTSSRAHMRRVQISREPMPYGNVLIVDDVETNIFVAKGLLVPYELKVDSACSGFEAIDKITDGKKYDIIFMDHMMPQMDGVEATKRIRDMGYRHPIVALTANAVTGQEDVFLKNGFDDFVSKPIDIRKLNVVLNKLIRDKQPPDVLEAARQRFKERKPPSAATPETRVTIEPRAAEVFSRDATKSLMALEAILKKGSALDENELRNYTIHVHGMRGALANIGKMELAAVAQHLEKSGRSGDQSVISSETAAFLSSLKALIAELTAEPESAPAGEADFVEEDTTSLREKLQIIKSACEEYDESTAEAILNELREAKWSGQTNEFLGKIAALLLHSEFEEISDLVSRFLENEDETR